MYAARPATEVDRRSLIRSALLVGGGLLGSGLLSACGASGSAVVSTTTSSVPAVKSVAATSSVTSSSAAKSVAATSSVTSSSAAKSVAATQTATSQPAAAVTHVAVPGVTTLFLLGGQDWKSPNGKQEYAVWQKDFPKIALEHAPSQNNLSSDQKLLTLIAAGTPPDVAWVDGPEVAGWGFKGYIQPLDTFYRQANLTESDFFPPVWKEIHYNGKIYAMCEGADANFGFFWNKDMFNSAGLPPDKPPTTIDEMAQYNERLMKKTPDGSAYTQFGIVPWTVYGNSNSMVTWGWAFGGEFYNEQTQKFTVDDPKIVDALTWMKSYATQFGYSAIQKIYANLPTHNTAFDASRLGMAPFGPWELPGLKQYAPNLKYGIGYLPQGPNGAPPHSSWVGGWCIGMPPGVKHPDLSWAFLKWRGASDSGTMIRGQVENSFSGYVKSPFPATIKNNPDMEAFYKIVVATQHQRPVTPVTDYFMGQLDKFVGSTILGKTEPAAALKQVNDLTQTELEKTLAAKK